MTFQQGDYVRFNGNRRHPWLEKGEIVRVETARDTSLYYWIITDAAHTDDVKRREVTTVLFPSDY